MSRALSKIRASSLPRRGLSREELARELSIPASIIDGLVDEDILPAQGCDGRWNLNEVDASINRLGLVYAVGYEKYVKIGFTSGGLRERVCVIQNACPELLTVYAAIGGTLKLEKELHLKFWKYRIRKTGEWFRLEGELADWINGDCL